MKFCRYVFFGVGASQNCQGWFIHCIFCAESSKKTFFWLLFMVQVGQDTNSSELNYFSNKDSIIFSTMLPSEYWSPPCSGGVLWCHHSFPCSVLWIGNWTSGTYVGAAMHWLAVLRSRWNGRQILMAASSYFKFDGYWECCFGLSSPGTWFLLKLSFLC